MYIVLLPPGDNPIAVNKYIIIIMKTVHFSEMYFYHQRR